MGRIDEIIRALNLEPHPSEGGYFAEIYRSADTLEGRALPPRYDGPRSLATAIYYLLTPDTFSSMHRLTSDEMFHFYAGDPVEMLNLKPEGSGEVVVLGPDVLAGMRPQHLVPRDVWQGCRLAPGGEFALLGTTVSPGFEYADYEAGDRDALCRAYPDFAERIRALTR
jgi:hypothetical protein